MGNFICCSRPSDQKKGTSVKTLLRRTEKPSRKRKRIDELVADALKREERDERQRRKREKKCLKKQSEDSLKKDASDDNTGDVSIKQQTLTNTDDVTKHAKEDATVTAKTKHTESSEATFSDKPEVNNTKTYLPSTDDTNVRNTEGYLSSRDDIDISNTEGYLPSRDDTDISNTDGHLSSTDDTDISNTEGNLSSTDDTDISNTEGYLPSTDDTDISNTEGYLPSRDDTDISNTDGHLSSTDDTDISNTEGNLSSTDDTDISNTEGNLPSTDDTDISNTEGYLPRTDDTDISNTEGYLPSTDYTDISNTEGYLPSTNDTDISNTEGYLPSTNDTDISNTEGYLPRTDDTDISNTEGYLPSTDNSDISNTERYLPSTDDTSISNTEGFLPSRNDSDISYTEGYLPSTDDTDIIYTEGYIPSTDATDISNTEGYLPSTNDTDISNTEGYLPSTDDTDISNTEGYLPSTDDTDISNTEGFLPSTDDTDISNTEGYLPSTDYTDISNIEGYLPSTNDTDISNTEGYLPNTDDTDINNTERYLPKADNTDISDTEGHLSKIDETDINSTAEYEAKQPDPCETLDQQTIPNIPLIVTELDDTEPSCDVIEYTQTSIYDLDNNNKTKEKCLCPETTDEATEDERTKDASETIAILDAQKTTKVDIEIITTESFGGLKSNIDNDGPMDESTTMEDNIKCDGHETYTESCEGNISTIKDQTQKDVTEEDAEINQDKVTIDKEHLHSKSTNRENNDDIHNATIDSQDGTEVNGKVLETGESNESTNEEQLNPHSTPAKDKDYLYNVSIDIQDVAEANEKGVEISETHESIYDKEFDSPRTSAEVKEELHNVAIDIQDGTETNDTEADIGEAKAYDNSEIVNDNSLPSKDEKTERSDDCLENKFTKLSIEALHDTSKGDTQLEYNPEGDKATTYANEVIPCETNVVNEGELTDVLTKTKENDREPMRQNDSVSNECVSNELSAEFWSFKESNEDHLGKKDVNTQQDKDLCSDTNDVDSLKANENGNVESSVRDVTSGGKLQSATALTKSDTNTCHLLPTNIRDTSKDGHDYRDKFERMPNDVGCDNDNIRSKSIPIRQCVELVTGFAKELKQANAIPKQRNKCIVSTTERYLNKTKSIILKSPLPKRFVSNRGKSWYGRRTSEQKRGYPGTIETMIRIGQKPQLKEIERLKNDPLNYENRRKILTEQDRRGSIEELKWSRHMRKGIRFGVMREQGAMENEKFKKIASKVNGGRYNGYNHLLPALKPTKTSIPSHSSSTSRNKPATIQSKNRSNNDSGFSSLSRISSTDDLNHITALSSETKRKEPFRSKVRQFEKTCKVVSNTKSNGTARAATPSANNTSFVGIGRQTSFINLGMDSCRKDL